MGVKRIIIVKSSSLPKIIANVKIHFAESLREEKVPVGPTIFPSPGPTFPREVAAEESDVIRSISVRARAAEMAAKENPYKVKNVKTERVIDSEIACLL